jgi:hypothetical protein
MMAKCMGYRTPFAAPGQPLSRGTASLTRLAIAAIFVGVLAIELVAIGASLPAMLQQDASAPVHSAR